MDFQDLVKFALICFDSLAWPLFALGYPLYASIQAIETNSETDTKKLVSYWIIFSLISLFEHAFMGILQWLPFWPYMKLMIVGWTMIPRFDGAFYVYNHFVHPCVYMDLPTIINWFKKLHVFFLNNFLADAADEYVKAHKFGIFEPKGTEPSKLQEDMKPVRVTEKREVTPVNPIPATEPNAHQTVNDTVRHSEINREVGFDLTEIPLDKQVQKEWTCAMCQVKVSSEKTWNIHLQGKKHMNACERLMNAKNQPCKGEVGSDSAVKEPRKDGSSQKNKKRPEGQVSAASSVKSTETSKCYQPIEESKKSVLATNVAGNKVKSSENVQGKQQVGKEHDETKIRQFRCTICNVTCSRSEDLNCHLFGRKHLAQIQKLSEGQVACPASSVAPKDKPVNPKTETSKCYLPIEESKKPMLATNVAANQVKSSENVQGQQQVGKEHGETKIPQFRCTVCNVTCSRSVDLNCHLWGRKHLAQIQKLSEEQVSAASSVAPKNSDMPYNSASACYKPVNPKTETNKCYLPIEESKKPMLATNVAANQVKSSENVQGQQQVGKEHGETKIPQFRCTVCNVTCSGSEDLNCHLWGRKHLAKIQKLSEEQASAASSVAPKNSDMPDNNASTCYKLVNPKTETSKCYLPIEESKKPVLATDMAGNQVKSSENVQGQQQVGKEHDETKIPQFRCLRTLIEESKKPVLVTDMAGNQVKSSENVQGQQQVEKEHDETKIPQFRCLRTLIEESKKPVLATDMAGNQVKSSENVQGQQQVEKEHGETKIPQFRCTICNVTCTRSEDLNCHIWGRKHLAEIQKLNNLQKGELT